MSESLFIPGAGMSLADDPTVDMYLSRPPFDELVILAIDCSGSMGNVSVEGGHTSKIREVIEHLFTSLDDSFIQRLEDSDNRLGYHLGIVAFSNQATSILRPQLLDDGISQSVITRLEQTGGTTNIAEALEAARLMAFEWLISKQVIKQGIDTDADSGIEPLAVILLLSDGGHSEGANPMPVVNLIKERFDEDVTILGETVKRGKIAVAKYGTSPVEMFPSAISMELAKAGIINNTDLLRAIASEPKELYYKEPKNGAQLRDFFFKSV